MSYQLTIYLPYKVDFLVQLFFKYFGTMECKHRLFNDEQFACFSADNCGCSCAVSEQSQFLQSEVLQNTSISSPKIVNFLSHIRYVSGANGSFHGEILFPQILEPLLINLFIWNLFSDKGRWKRKYTEPKTI